MLGPLFVLVDLMNEIIVTITYAIMIIVMFCQVVLRYVFNSPLMWPEELSRFLFIWIVYLGAPLAILQRAHIEVDYFVGRLPAGHRWLLRKVFGLMSIAWLGVVLVKGVEISRAYMSASAYTLPMLPLGLFYAPIALGAVLMLMIVNLVRTLVGTEKENERCER